EYYSVTIFTESALVQIAGRVGRSPKYPTGEVIFFQYGKTKAMNDARMQILKMNKQGRSLGFLD
ncbi:DNA/RNA helicase, partial [Schinkia azotoformans]|nr:DNA/RNA helicase [Schinkia azotoformans]